MQVVVHDDSIKRFRLALASFRKTAAKPLDDAIRQTAKDIAADARRSLRSRGVSRPGQPPGRRTGQLAKSIRFKRWRRALGYSVFVRQPGKPYALFLEESKENERRTRSKGGRASRGVLKKRPFIKLAAQRHETNFNMRVQQGIEDTLKAMAAQ